MPRDGSGVYTKPYPSVVSGTTIESLVYNGQVDDVTLDLNTPRPVVAGGTGANNAAGGLFNLGGEKATQVVTSYDSHVWVPGSFRSAAGAIGAPNATAVFSGVCYIHEAIANPPTNQNVTVEARDVSDGVLYIRTKTAGTWSAWKTERANIYAAPLDALAYSGMQINGSFEVNQQAGHLVNTTASGSYICDGFVVYKNGTMAFAAGTTITTPITVGIPGGLYAATTTAQTTIGGGDYLVINHPIEGYRISRLAWGTSSAQPITIGFWSQHFRTGVYTVGIGNTAGNRSYLATYTHNASNVVQYNTITIPGCVDGVWNKDNASGIIVQFVIASGIVAPAANTWFSAGYQAAPGQTNGVASTSDVFRITGVVVLPGIEAPTAAQSPLIMRPYDQELVTCQRYYEKAPAVVRATGQLYLVAPWKVSKRATPTLTVVFESGTGATFVPVPAVPATGNNVSAVYQTTLHSGDAVASITGDARL
jgi:hypothetical protein